LLKGPNMTEECIIIENIKDKNQEENKMNKIIIVVIMFVLTILISGCANTYELKYVIECEEGVYKIPSNMMKKAELTGIAAKDITIIDYDNTCEVLLRLKKPMNVLGTETLTVPVLSCNKNAIELYSASTEGYTEEEIVRRACS